MVKVVLSYFGKPQNKSRKRTYKVRLFPTVTAPKSSAAASSTRVDDHACKGEGGVPTAVRNLRSEWTGPTFGHFMSEDWHGRCFYLVVGETEVMTVNRVCLLLHFYVCILNIKAMHYALEALLLVLIHVLCFFSCISYKVTHLSSYLICFSDLCNLAHVFPPLGSISLLSSIFFPQDTHVLPSFTPYLFDFSGKPSSKLNWHIYECGWWLTYC